MPFKGEKLIEEPVITFHAKFGDSLVPVIGAKTVEEAKQAAEDAYRRFRESYSGDDEAIANAMQHKNLGKFSGTILGVENGNEPSSVVFTQIKQADGGSGWQFR